jgi:ribosomal protein S4
LNQVNDRFEKLKNLIIFKKKTGFLKKKDKLKNFLLLRLNNLKNFKFLQNSLNKGKIYKNLKLKNFNKISRLKIKTDHSDVNKFLELKKRWYKIFSKNRGLLKVYSNIKKKKQFQLTKIFYKNIKREVKLNFLKNEFTLANLIVRSKFVFTNTEAIFFVKNGFVFVNGFCIVNPKHVISVGDVVNIIFLKNYFFFFKTNFSQKLRLTYALGYRL